MSIEPYDIVGVGIGPFNLGLAALAQSIPQFRACFCDRNPMFDWHPGMIIEGTTLQESFLADLVTPVDPCHPLSFLSYVKSAGRLYQFAIRDSHFVTRREYNEYCRWAVERLPSLRFATAVESVDYDASSRLYHVEVDSAEHGRQSLQARNVVVGVGTVPAMPTCLRGRRLVNVFHSADYLEHRASLLRRPSVTVLGSGQSAAEVFYDMLVNKDDATKLSWITRSERFFPMEYGKLTLEMASPDYIDHFHGLPEDARGSVLGRQDLLYKGINLELIDRIYDQLYDRSVGGAVDDVRIATNSEMSAIETDGDVVQMTFLQRELRESFEHQAHAVILATGYEYRTPACLAPLESRVRRESTGMPVIRRNYSIAGDVGNGLFVQNAELHSHGFTASDLSVGPYRNATILNSVLGREHFQLERKIAFQDFGLMRPWSSHDERRAYRRAKDHDAVLRSPFEVLR